MNLLEPSMSGVWSSPACKLGDERRRRHIVDVEANEGDGIESAKTSRPDGSMPA